MRKTPFLIAGMSLLVLTLFALTSLLWPAAAQEKPGLVGSETCGGCHDNILANLGRTGMGRLFLKHPRSSLEQMGCESCHGPGEVHAESGGTEFGDLIRFAKGTPIPVEKRNDACLQCHEKKKLLYWKGSPHEARDVACSSCHKIHEEGMDISNRALLSNASETETCAPCHKQQVAQQMRFSHHPLREGKMQCSSCHNPHGTTSDALLKANTLNDLCFTCHAEKRGPFLFQHTPVTEDCSNCHLPHGSNHYRLLKVPELRICRQCHVDFHPVQGGQVSQRHVVGRLCTDCHSNIHGSNHPTNAGNRFLR